MAYAPDGTIVWATFNWPGSQHDSRLAAGLYKKLENTATRPDGRVFTLAADAAFKKGSHIFKPLKRDAVEKMMGDLDIPIEDILGRLRGHRACVSARQASEWGMRAVQRENVYCECNRLRLVPYLPSDLEPSGNPHQPAAHWSRVR